MSIIEFFVVIFLGWPAIIVTAILTVMGLLRSDHRFLVAAAVLAVPFSWFLSNFPRVSSPVFLVPVLLLGSAYSMYRDRQMLAWILAIPLFLGIILLFLAVMSQPVGV